MQVPQPLLDLETKVNDALSHLVANVEKSPELEVVRVLLQLSSGVVGDVKNAIDTAVDPATETNTTSTAEDTASDNIDTQAQKIEVTDGDAAQAASAAPAAPAEPTAPIDPAAPTV